MSSGAELGSSTLYLHTPGGSSSKISLERERTLGGTRTTADPHLSQEGEKIGDSIT
jgi:hypothetical protein